MVTRPKRLPEGEIRKVVEQIVQLFHPQKVILFGSYAHGNATSDSDADLLVVLETDQRPLRQAAGISSALEHRFPLDILVKTPEELAERLEEGDSFISEVLKEGKVLYEKTDGGMDQEG